MVPAVQLKASLTLTRNTLRRLLIGMILHEQRSADMKGLINEDQALAGLIVGKANKEIDQLEVTEDVLGFDSLGILKLITSLNRFFDLSTTGIEDYLLVKRAIGAWIDLLDQHQKIVAGKTNFGFQTSGSTGAPKLIHHSTDVLLNEMRAQLDAPFSHIKPSARIITLVPPQHIYGFLFGCILPELVSCDVIDLHYAAPSAVFRHAHPGDLIVATPFHWALLAQSGLRFRANVCGVTSAGPSNAQTWNALSASNLSQLTEIYGSTETAGVGYRTKLEDAFSLLPHLEFTDGVVMRKDHGVNLDIQDRLNFLTPTSFQVGKRLDDVVQVAGINVSPNFVREQILGVDGVADAAVRLGNERLRAFVVPQAGADEATLETRLHKHFTLNLEAAARPGEITFGSELPRTQLGKAADWA